MRESGKASTGTVLFVYALPIRHEFQRYAEGTVPSHRLWGAAEMQQRGWRVKYCPDPAPRWARFGGLGWRLWQSAWAVRRSVGACGVVAVHEVSAMFLLLARRVGVLRCPVLVLNMAMLHSRNLSGCRLLLWRWLLGGADAVASLVRSQNSGVARHFGVSWERLVHLPMGVDAAFGGRADAGAEERFCLAVGTNDGKDFETLVEAMPLGEKLVVVTDSFNAAKVERHRSFGSGIEVRMGVPAVELRELYLRAAVVIIPLADTRHGSGHTVLLETMALGKIVIVSESVHMRDYINNGVNALCVPVGDSVAMRRALLEALNYPERFAGMRERAASDARRHFGMGRFAAQLEEWLGLAVLGRGNGQKARVEGAVCSGRFENAGNKQREERGQEQHASIP